MDAKQPKRHISTLTLAWIALIGNLIVILQGAVVRATGSGAGCGSHWPTCNGEVIPLAHTTESLIEFSHRLLSLVVLVLGIWLLRRVWQHRQQNLGLWVWGSAAFFFLVVEALLGAATVLFGLTGENTSVARGLMVASHLINSLLLVGALTLTVIYANHKRPAWPLRLEQQGTVLTVLALGLLGMLVLMFSGGIAAMGNTMFPSESLGEGLAADFDPNSHPLIRLRILHPLIAISVGIYLFLSLGLGRLLKPVTEAKPFVQALFSVYLLQLLIGTLNLAFLAPTALQLLHLFTAVLSFALLTVVIIYTLGFDSKPRVQPVTFDPVKEI